MNRRKPRSAALTLDEAHRQIDELRRQIDELHRQIDEVRHERDQARKERDETRRQLDETRRQLDETRRELNEVRRKGRRFADSLVTTILTAHKEIWDQRNRQRSLETIQQDAKIYRLRTEDKKRWPWKKLGRHFAMTGSGARKAFERHQQRRNEDCSN
jgi:uncharacterized coiled-coil DUF342 family protein